MADVINQHERTYLVSGGRGTHDVEDGAARHGAPVNQPVDFTSTYTYRPGQEVRLDYAREGIPSWQPLEEMLARLEAGTRTSYSGSGLVTTAHQTPVDALPALLFSSGMAAVSAVVHLLPPGGHLILPRHCYMGLGSLARHLASQGLLTLHHVDIAETEQVLTTIRDVATLAQAQGAEVMLWAESPTNPMLEVADLPALLAEARRRGVLTAVDNTFATPLRQRPLTHGADVVVHSVTKFLAGHSDLVMGAAVTSSETLHQKLHDHRTMHGAIPGPMEVFLALRGIRTLAVRLDAAEKNAAALASRLQELTEVADLPVRAVNYPGLTSHPQHERAAAQLSGFGAILTVEIGPRGESDPTGDEAASQCLADAVIENLRIWTPATSLGGVESLAERRARHAGEPQSVPPGLIRLSVGIEDADDLFDDLLNALRTAAGSAAGADAAAGPGAAAGAGTAGQGDAEGAAADARPQGDSRDPRF